MTSLSIAAYAVVRGGNINLDIVGDTLTYSGEIQVRPLFETETKHFSGTITDPRAFKFDTYATAGTSIQIGAVNVTVLSATATSAQLQILDTQYNVSGTVGVLRDPDGNVAIGALRLEIKTHGITAHVVAAAPAQLVGLV